MREVAGPAAGDDDATAVAVEHARNHGAAGEVDAEDIDLENIPPVRGLDFPGVRLADVSPGVRDE